LANTKAVFPLTKQRVRERRTDFEMLPPLQITLKKKGGAVKLFDLDPPEIAKQITLDLAQIYTRIKPIELFDLAWTKPKLQHLAPNVLTLISRFNYYSTWAITEILSEPALRHRLAVVGKVLKVMLVRPYWDVGRIKTWRQTFCSLGFERIEQLSRTLRYGFGVECRTGEST